MDNGQFYWEVSTDRVCCGHLPMAGNCMRVKYTEKRGGVSPDWHPDVRYVWRFATAEEAITQAKIWIKLPGTPKLTITCVQRDVVMQLSSDELRECRFPHKDGYDVKCWIDNDYKEVRREIIPRKEVETAQ